MTARRVLIAVFPEFNTLDMNGPFETLHSPDGGKHFAVTLASETEITTSSEGVMVKVGTTCRNPAPEVSGTQEC